MTDSMDNAQHPDVKTQLLMLRGITKLTGALHEAQLEQLKLWPWALQTKGLERFDIEINQEANLVRYSLTITKGCKKSKKLDYLTTWVQWLLGEEWKVNVDVIDGKVTSSPPKRGKGRTGKSNRPGRGANVPKRRGKVRL